MLYYFPKHNVGYYHISKTAGRTALLVFESVYGKHEWVSSGPNTHEPLISIKDMLGIDVFDALKLVTTIRNPYDRVVSLYTWVRRSIGNKELIEEQKELNPKILEIHNLDFSDYIDWYCENQLSYKDLLFVDDALPNIHFIRFEFLHKDIEDFFGCEVKLAHRNPSPRRRAYRFYFTNQEMYDKITKKYDWCFNQGFYVPE